MAIAPIVQLRSKLPNAAELRGKELTPAHVTLKLEGDADVYKPDGNPLCMLRRGAISKEMCASAYPALHELRKYKTDNRGAYSGATRTKAVFADGTTSKNSRTRNADGTRHLVASAVVGYSDRMGGRFPFCRETMFTAKHPEQWREIVPMIECVAGVFKEAAPARYATQLAECRKAPDYVIGKTPFTTLTVNNNVIPSAAHTDKGDLKEGLGVISVVRRGVYTGAWLVFPEYLVGVDLEDGDVFFFNSHDIHGVTDWEKKSEDAERISVVYYMRSRIVDCLPLAEELARAQSRGEFEEDQEVEP